MLTYDAGEVFVNQTLLKDLNYTEERDTTFALSQTVDAEGASYSVEARNELIEYARSIDHSQVGDQDVVRLTAVATPEVEGTSQDAFVEQISAEALSSGLQSGYMEFSVDKPEIDSHTIAPFNRETSVPQYAGVATYQEQTVEIYLHVLETVYQTDYITVVGVYPRSFVETEQTNVLTLMESIEHEM